MTEKHPEELLPVESRRSAILPIQIFHDILAVQR